MLVRKHEANPDTKVIIVGDPSVGKTSLLNQFNAKLFSFDSESTIGAMFVAKEVSTGVGSISLYIWDTAGQERFRSLIPMYSRNAAAALLVIDSTAFSSYESKDQWYSLLLENCPARVKIYIIANKIDLPARIPMDNLEIWARSQSLPFFKASALDYDSVEAVFVRVAEDIIRNRSDFVDPRPLTEHEEGGESCFC